MIKAVIFDVDGVLIDSLAGNTRLFRDAMKLAGYQKLPTQKDYKKTFHLPAREGFKLFSGSKDKKEIDRLMHLLYERRHEHPLNIMPGSLEVIKKLAKKYKLALVTSRTKGGLDHYMESSKTHNYFKILVHLDLYKNPKPHPEPLLLACRQLKIRPEEAVYVGDTHADIEAARAAGMKVILYPKKRIRGADAYAKDISEIPKIVAALC